MRHLNHITAEHLTVGQEALVAGRAVGRGEVRSNRLRAHLSAWSPCYRPTVFMGPVARPTARPAVAMATMARSLAVSMARAHKRQPMAAGGQGSPRDTRLPLPLKGGLSARLALGCPAGTL